ncbi:tyrosine-protein phosphatase PtbB [Leifsonia kafniensis]|uniref:Tyrosine-protein phosphatase PtbB n=1 Tax=Leifsonia kafniensis TaxID=475957 RepID=A0ABP7KCQ4_9MICO
MDSTVRIAVDGTFNLREPAGYPAAHGVTRSGVLYRSDGLKGLTDRGRAELAELGVHTIIDLRDDFEREVQPDAIDDLEIETVHIPVYEGSAAANSGPGITLPSMYESIVVEHGEVVVRALRLIASPDAGPVLVHCTAGKDRTGIVIALALRAVGVAPDVVIADYARSESNLAGEWLEAMVALTSRFGIADTPELRGIMGSTPAEVMAELLRLIDERYGSVTDYLLSQGFTADDVRLLETKLVRRA